MLRANIPLSNLMPQLLTQNAESVIGKNDFNENIVVKNSRLFLTHYISSEAGWHHVNPTLENQQIISNSQTVKSS